MRLDPVNAVSSFHYYMWNAWGEEECKITFGGAYKHFWEKWNSLASKSILGAAERFYAELSDNNREMLVNRAVALYDGKATREEPHDEDVYVCDACGSRKIEPLTLGQNDVAKCNNLPPCVHFIRGLET